MAFNKWFDTFIEEKGIDTGFTFEFDEAGMFHLVETAVVIDWVKKLDPETKAKIKNNFVKIDFVNGNVMHFMEFMAKGMIKATNTMKGAA
mgnify:FL=1|jgi:hypothetical protein|tara:strand:+ start:107 stop:376 length:270 start_codon:yes stop_codon:yes gene_type:complete